MSVLTRTDVAKLIERDEIKARLKALEQELKPKIEAAVKEAGNGAEIRIGGHVVLVSMMPHTNTSWKTVAERVGTAAEIAAVLDDCRETTFYSQAKVVG